MTDKRIYIAKKVVTAILNRHSLEKGWVVFDEVSDNDGCRRMDVVAFHCWGNPYAVAYEVKVTRSDWFKENADLGKHAFFEAHCRQRFFVAPKDVIDKEEVPDGWGLLHVIGKPESPKLRIVKQAPAKDIDPLPLWIMRPFYKLQLSECRAQIESAQVHKASERVLNHEANVEQELRKAESARREADRLKDNAQYVMRELAVTAGHDVPWNSDDIPEHIDIGDLRKGFRRNALKGMERPAMEMLTRCERFVRQIQEVKRDYDGTQG